MNGITLFGGLVLTGLLFASYAANDPGKDRAVKSTDNKKIAPLVLQKLDYTENPIDIPNPDRDAYRGRWQNIATNAVNETNSPLGVRNFRLN